MKVRRQTEIHLARPLASASPSSALTPPQKLHAVAFASFGVSQWAEASLKCVLKGGSPPPPPEQAEIVLKLRGHVPSSIMDAPDPAAAGQGDAAAAGKPKKK